jgi:transposase-like protein
MASELFAVHGEAIRSALVDGLSIADVAREHAISPRTVERWLARGRSNHGSAYGPFARAVDEARAGRALPPPGELPLDAAELRLLLARAARRGNIRAMELAAKLLAAEEGASDGDLGF